MENEKARCCGRFEGEVRQIRDVELGNQHLVDMEETCIREARVGEAVEHVVRTIKANYEIGFIAFLIF